MERKVVGVEGKCMFPDIEYDDDRLGSLRDALVATDKKLEELLVGRSDGEIQKDHIADAYGNSQKILEDLLKRNLSEGERLLLGLAVKWHDIGKWEDREKVRKAYEDKDIVGQLGLSEQELHILEIAIEATRDEGYNFHRQDIAHHIFSALVLTAEAKEDGALSALNPQDVEMVRKVVLYHQYGAYYRQRARDENELAGHTIYTEAEIEAIRRKPKLASIAEGTVLLDDQDLGLGDYISVAVHDGDKLSMCQIGRVDDDGSVHLGGYAKIVGLEALYRFSRLKLNPESGFFASLDENSEHVRQELITEKAQHMYEKFVKDIDFFKKLLIDAGFCNGLEVIEGVASDDLDFTGEGDEGLNQIMKSKRKLLENAVRNYYRGNAI